MVRQVWEIRKVPSIYANRADHGRPSIPRKATGKVAVLRRLQERWKREEFASQGLTPATAVLNRREVTAQLHKRHFIAVYQETYWRTKGDSNTPDRLLPISLDMSVDFR